MLNGKKETFALNTANGRNFPLKSRKCGNKSHMSSECELLHSCSNAYVSNSGILPHEHVWHHAERWTISLFTSDYGLVLVETTLYFHESGVRKPCTSMRVVFSQDYFYAQHY